MNIKILFVLLIPFALSIGCRLKSDNDNLQIEGAWYFIKNDSLYYEIIFDQNSFYSYDENNGDYFGSYKMLDDSMQFYNQNNDLTLAGKITPSTKNNFILKTKYYTAQYTRLDAPIDVSLIFGQDENYMEKYISLYISRKEEWQRTR